MTKNPQEQRKEKSLLTLNSLIRLSKDRKRVGRGPGSGLGKTCGRGYNGALSRTGSSRIQEGGQTSIIRRLRKFGFVSLKNKAKKSISVDRLMEIIEQFFAPFDQKEKVLIDIAFLRSASVIKGRFNSFKVIGSSLITNSNEDLDEELSDSLESSDDRQYATPEDFYKKITIRANGFSKEAKKVLESKKILVEFAR